MKDILTYDRLREVYFSKKVNECVEEVYEINEKEYYTDFEISFNVCVNGNAFMIDSEKKLLEDYLWYYIQNKTKDKFKFKGTPYTFCYCEPKRICIKKENISNELNINCEMVVHAENPYSNYVY